MTEREQEAELLTFNFLTQVLITACVHILFRKSKEYHAGFTAWYLHGIYRFCKSVDVGFDRCIEGREGKCLYRVNIFDGRYKIQSIL